MPATFTVKQVADILGYSTNSIYTFLKAKRIKSVRVGKGRFRIPQSELDRLLLIKSGSSKEVSLPKSPINVSEKPYIASVYSNVPQTVSYAPDVFVDPIALHGRVAVPSLFDWFVGVGSIILGFAMFLFSKSYEEFAASSSVSWIPMLRAIFIAGGFGLLLSDIVGKKSVKWTMVFRAVLLCVYSLYTVVSIYSGNTDAGVVFGLIVPLLVMSFNTSFNGVKLFIGYCVSIALYLLGGLIIHSSWFALSGMISTAILMAVWAIGAFVVYSVMNRSHHFLIGCTLALCFILGASSLTYAGQMMWGRALYLLMAALFAVFVPIWKTLAFAHKRDRSFVFGVIGSLLLLFVFVIGFIRVMQSNMIVVASREIDNKVVYGKVSVESSLESAKNSLSALSTNLLLIEALETKKSTTLIDLSKTVVGTNASIRRVVVASTEGKILSNYPHSEDQKSSVLETDYFARAKASKQMIVSDVFEVVTDASKRKVVVIAVPILNKKEVVGVLSGFLDIDTIGMKLQQLSAESMGEYAMVVDKGARLIIHPDISQIGVEADAQDPIRMALAGKRGVHDEYKTGEVSVLTAVDTINDKTGWAIAMRVPLVSVLRMTETSVSVLVFLIVVSSCIIAIFFMSHRKKSSIAASDQYVVHKGDSS